MLLGAVGWDEPGLERSARLGAFSFFANKNLALGEGGMLVTDDLALAERARLLRSHGLSADTWARHRSVAGRLRRASNPGFNHRLDEPRAALGTRLLMRLASDNRCRTDLAHRYIDALGDLEGARPAFIPDGDVTCAWHIFPLLLGRDVDRAAFRAGMQPSRRADQRALPAAAPDDRVFVAINVRAAIYRKVWMRHRHSAFVPHMTSLQQECVIRAIKAVIGYLSDI